MSIFNMVDIDDIERMTLVERSMRMDAYSLRQVDSSLQIHMQSWANRTVNAVKNEHYVFETFHDFFDYEKAIEIAKHPVKKEKEMDQELVQIARRLQNFRRKEVKHG